MWIRCAVVLSLCVFGFGCEKKGASGDADASKDGGAQITITEGGVSQSGTATVEDAAEGQKAAVLSTPPDKKDK
ncbi:MAG: hypothetical protein CMJ40_09380 [Phycisphaerae bacterium]|nr:hypothetical protein [Phycisphaerae bacterium]